MHPDFSISHLQIKTFLYYFFSILAKIKPHIYAISFWNQSYKNSQKSS